MKIAYISPSVIPSRTANSIHVMKVCQALKSLNHEVELIAPDRGEIGLLEKNVDIWKHYGIEFKFPIKKIKSRSWLREYDYEMSASYYARKLRPDYVITRNVPAAAFCSLMGICSVLEIHNPLTGHLQKLFFNVLTRNRSFAMLVVITNYLKNYYLSIPNFKGHEEKVKVFPDGVDLNLFQNSEPETSIKSSLGFHQDGFVIGYSGHLYPGRGIELIIKLGALFPMHLFIVIGGQDKDISRYKASAEKLGLQNIRFLGFIENGKLPKYLKACDILLMPYQNKVEILRGGDTSLWMSPMKMFEYMACGKVIISSDLPVLREVLNDGNAILCSPENIEEWKNAINSVEKKEEFTLDLGEKAKEDSKRFSWKNRMENILNRLES